MICKLCSIEGRDLGVRDLAVSVGLSQSEVYNSLGRCRQAQLLYEKDRVVKLVHRRIVGLLVHGVPSVYFAERGAVGVGMPTSIFAAPLVEKFTSETGSEIPLVWAVPNGRTRGETLVPLYPTAPAAAAADRVLYELLVLIDCVRSGKTKERKVAAEMLEKRIMPAAAEETKP